MTTDEKGHKCLVCDGKGYYGTLGNLKCNGCNGRKYLQTEEYDKMEKEFMDAFRITRIKKYDVIL
jgi:hypothetical protein